MPRILLLSNPRSGSCYLQDLLNCHPEIEIAEELLNDEFGLLENPLESIQQQLAELHSTYVGFKVFPEQVYVHKLHFGDLLQTIGATHVIILWREQLLESLVSRRIAEKTGQWYSTDRNDKSIRTVEIDPNDLEEYTKQLTTEWSQIGSEWPVDVRPIFVKFEDLLLNPITEVKRVVAELSCSSDQAVFSTPSERQNPGKVEDKVVNFHQLNPNYRDGLLNVEKILLDKINISLQISPELLQFAPDREPCMPANGWKYRVAEPYLPSIAKQNAFDALQSGSISSAGYWPRELAKKLRTLFHCPVAQPCSNGFTALLISLQASSIGEGDEVIMPTMTMVAVPNAVHFVRATPVFADNAINCYNPHWEQYERVATEKTKAIIVTHTYGVPVPDIEEIAERCKSRGWILIEDISECVGVTCARSNGEVSLLGTFGDYAIASLYANKIVQGGDGGFVIAKEAKMGKRLASIVNHGFTPSFHFVHFEPAPNAKIHGIGAAIATGCLDKLDDIMKHRTKLANLYRTKLQELPVKLMPVCGPCDTPWVFGIQCCSKSERTQLRAFLAKKGIETRDFFFNLHLQPAYQCKNDSHPPSLPQAEVLGSTGFYLPTHSNLQDKDIDYICASVNMFFTPNTNVKIEEVPRRKKLISCLQVRQDDFAVEIRRYRDSGEIAAINSRGLYVDAVKLGLQAEEYMIHERLDHITILLSDMKECIKSAQEENDPLVASMKSYFTTFINYHESQQTIETCKRPWTKVNLNEESFKHSNSIPTTTDPETLQLLVWVLQQHKPSTIWEIGSWFGHATALMAEVCNSLGQKYHIFACDAFKWQPWMQFYLQDSNVTQHGKSFVNIFNQNIQPYAEHIDAVQWPYDISKLPVILENQKPQLVFLDITQQDEDLEEIWKLIKKNLVVDETLILFNGMAHSSIPFFTRHANELHSVAKPQTIAKLFRYVDSSRSQDSKTPTYEEVEDYMRETIPLKRSLRFHTNPGWDHHHQDLFCKSIDVLRAHFHSDDSDVIFIPAVEETMCDQPEIFCENAWIGIIHSVAEYPELFYTPDLQRLCTSPKYLDALTNCKGLFTLTTFQTEYLKKHLPSNFTFPIQQLVYPTEVSDNSSCSLVPQIMQRGQAVNLLHVGSFARNFELFFNLKVHTFFKKVFVASDKISQAATQNVPTDVKVVGRLSEEEYETALTNSVVFLSLKYEGAANTLILECIARKVPIIVPAMSSCLDYVGHEYPLTYDPAHPDLENLLNLETIQKTIQYLETMDTLRFSRDAFVNDVKKGIVLISSPPSPSSLVEIKSTGEHSSNLMLSPQGRQFSQYDVTICICSYKRTHNLPALLESLWNNQDFEGTIQIIIWNNNDCRHGIVSHVTSKYIQESTSSKSLEVISSTENHYCSIRFAMPALMRSNCLLICDDDIIPEKNFISFFYTAHKKNPNDVLCVRGHVFSPHTIQQHDPTNVWMDYENLRFKDDDTPEQLIHFVHADACLIPKEALQEVSSVSMPDPTFVLVDDYWMSFVLSHKFNRKLRKLSVAGLAINPINRTCDSDQPGLALHTLPEVQDARLRLYVHHMVQGWPKWESLPTPKILPVEEMKRIHEKKQNVWSSKPQIGFNIPSTLDQNDIDDLVKTGCKLVRIGAVGVGGDRMFELSEFLTEPKKQLEKLLELVEKLRVEEINVILTLDRRLVSSQTWVLIAEKMALLSNVVGYDVINEPFTELELDLHWNDVEKVSNDTGLYAVVTKYADIIQEIRKVDQSTPIILEPTFWGRVHGFAKFPIDDIIKLDSNIIISFHFYEPMLLTSRVKNKGQFSFPGSIPWYDTVKFCEETMWDESEVCRLIQSAKSWAEEKGVRIFIGEFGICRDTLGGSEYLKAVINACQIVGVTGLAFSFRDPDWEAMNYEFGSNIDNCCGNDNSLMSAVLNGIADMK